MTNKDSIIGHEQQRKELLNDLESGNLSHAYLFVGPQHVGKTTVARWFAQEILLRDVPAAQRADAEEQMRKLIHHDLLVLDQLWIEEQCEDWHVIAKSSNLPQQHRSKAPKLMKTDTISIEDVRVIQEHLQATGDLPHRVCIITSVERMRDEAANAFLKTLEEPPPGRVFLLTAERLTDVLPTIISRTRVVQFTKLGHAAMKLHIADAGEDVPFLLHLSLGAPGTMLQLRDDPDALRLEKTRHGQAASVWETASLGERLSLLSPLFERGQEAERFLLHLALALRESPRRDYKRERALNALIRGLETNAHRQLIVQRFAYAL